MGTVLALAPTLEEAIYAAQGLTDDVDGQAEIAARLIGLPETDVKATILKATAPSHAWPAVCLPKLGLCPADRRLLSSQSVPRPDPLNGWTAINIHQRVQDRAMFYSCNKGKGRDRAGLLPQTAAFIRSFLTMRAAHREFQAPPLCWPRPIAHVRNLTTTLRGARRSAFR